MAAHRYWKINVTRKGSDPVYCNVSEIELRAAIGGADQTGSGTATASSFQSSGFEGDKAFDNNTETLWAFILEAPQWVKYDFGVGNDKDIVEVALRSGSFGYQMFESFELQYSDNDADWYTLFSVEYEPIWDDNETRVFSASDSPTKNGNKSAWRINVSATDGGAVNTVGIAEMELRLTPGGADQCSGGKAYGTEAYRYAYGPPKAFDDNASTLYVTYGNTLPQWLGYRFASAQEVVQIAITARNDGYHNQSPKDFTVQYWDGSAWQTALTVTGSTGWTSGETRTWSFSAAAASAGRAQVFACT